MTRGEVRSTLVVLVLVVVAVIALWPRSEPDGLTPDPGVSASAAGGGLLPVRPVDPAELAAARAQADLAPCPAPGPDAAPASGAATVPALSGLVLDCLGGPGPVDLSRALAGRTTLVNLWASWCGPCREEIPALSAYAARPGAADLLGVAVNDTPTASLSLMSALDARYPSVSDPTQVVARRAGAVPVLPASVVVRPDGAVVPLPPEVFASPDAVALAVDRALAAPVPAGSGG